MYLEVYSAIFQFLESSSPLMTDITHKSVTELTTTLFPHKNARPYLVSSVYGESPENNV